MEGGNALLSPQTGTIIWTIITVGMLLVLLRLFAWKPVLGLLEERERTIKDSLEDARKAREEAESYLNESREAMRKSRQEMSAAIEKGQKEADRLRQELMAKAQSDAEETRRRGVEAIEREKQAAVQEIRTVAVDLAVSAARKIVSSSMDDQAQRKLAAEFLSKMEEGSDRPPS